jgi:hypothetical protein
MSTKKYRRPKDPNDLHNKGDRQNEPDTSPKQNFSRIAEKALSVKGGGMLWIASREGGG